MDKCIKCGGTLPAGARLCPYCGNPVSYYEEKMQPVPPAPPKKTGGRIILITSIVVLSVLLISSLAVALMLWTTSTGAPPKLGVSPGSLDFGTLHVGSQSSQVLTVSNSGKQDLKWSADKGAANWLTLDPGQGRIPSGGSQTIYVRADATLLTAGRYSASISFTSNGGSASVSAVLIVASGSQAQGAPAVSGISPTSGSAAGGTTVTIRGSGFTGATEVLFGTATSTFIVNSDTQITVISPAGSGTVHVTVITPKGTSATSNADQFAYTGTQPVPPIPTVASIWPTSGPAAGGTIVTITGTGFNRVSTVLFGATTASFWVNTDKQITVKSPAGSGTVDVKVITPGGTSNAARFTYNVPPPPPPPAHVPFIKSISPTSGPVAGGTKVTITGTDFTKNSKVKFGTVPASNVTWNSDTQITAVSPAVKNSGTVDVTVTTSGGTSKTSNADRFTYLQSAQIAVVPSSLDFGKMDPNTTKPLTVTVKNTGGQPLQWNVAVQPVGTTWLKVDKNHDTVQPGGQQAIKVTADTKNLTAGQKYDAILIFTSNGGDKQVSARLIVTAPPSAPVVSLSPTSLSFGNQNVGTTSAEKTVTLKNSGTANLAINSIDIGGTNKDDFALTRLIPISLAPGEECTIGVKFTPTATGDRIASLTILDNASDSPQSVALNGTGTSASAPAVSLSPTSLSFGDQQVGTTSAAQTVTLKNSGTANLTINSIGLSGTNPGDIVFTPNCPFTPMGPDASCTISVAFSPTATGSRSASLTISDNASDSPQSVALSGTGTGTPSAPAVSLSPTSLSFGDQQVNSTSDVKTVTLTNNGTADLTINSIAIDGVNKGDFAQTNDYTNSLAPGAHCTISVTFTPTATGDRIASLTILDNASDSPQSVALSGTGSP